MLSSIVHQQKKDSLLIRGTPEPDNIFSRILWTRDKVGNTIDTTNGSPEETVMFMIYDWGFPRMQNNEENGRFYRTHSHARDEWCMEISSLHACTPYHMGNLLERLYSDDRTDSWSNGDDFSFYAFVGEYLWRKFRVIFYNSEKRETGEKIPFQELLRNNEPVRVCWY